MSELPDILQIMASIKEYLSVPERLTQSVAGYLINEDKILLGQRKKVSLGLGQNLIAGIGGKLEEGETHDDALRRELLEEIQIKVLSSIPMGKVTFLFPHQPKWDQTSKVYLVDRWEGVPTETEVIKPLWFNMSNLPREHMWDDNLYWIPLMLSGKKINGVFLYDQKGQVIEHTIDTE